jgi:hypothetical protein
MNDTRQACDCFDCSCYCQCKCHKAAASQTHTLEDLIEAFDQVFDLVHFKEMVIADHITVLQLDDDGLNKLGKFFANHSYYPDERLKAICHDPKRGKK